jgi:hypothetical protein
MSKKDALYELIQRMTKTEKRYFKIMAGLHKESGKNNSVALFDAIEGMKEFDNKKLEAKLKGSVLLKNIRLNKFYLYKQLIKSLELYHSSGNIDSELQSCLRQFDILHKKGLYDQCYGILDKAKKIAGDVELPLQMLGISYREFTLKRVLGRYDEMQAFISKNEKKQFDYIREYKNIIEYQNFGAIVYSIRKEQGERPRDKEVIKIINGLLKHPLLKTPDNCLTLNAKGVYYHSKTTLNQLLGNYLGNDTLMKVFVNEIEAGRKQNPKSLAGNYFIALQALRAAQLKIYKFDEALVTCTKLGEVFKKTQSLQGGNNTLIYFDCCFSTMINCYINLGEINKASEIQKDGEKELVKWGIPPESECALIFYLYSFYISFCLENYAKCSFWLNKINRESVKTSRQDTILLSRILTLFVRYETEDIDQIEYHTKSLYRFLTQRNAPHKFEKIILQFMKKELAGKKSGKFVDNLKVLKRDLLTIEYDELENAPLETFNFISWIDSKIQQKRFVDVLVARNKIR